MKFENTPTLKKWLDSAGRVDLAGLVEFEIDAANFRAYEYQLRRQNYVPAGEIQEKSAFRCLTHGVEAPKKPSGLVREISVAPAAPSPLTAPVNLEFIEIHLGRFQRKANAALFLLVAIILFLLFSGTAHAAQNSSVNPAIVVATCGTVPANYPTANRAPETVNTSGLLCAGVSVSATVVTAGLATSANQTNGNQVTQVCDSGGECATVTGNALDVNAVVNIPGSLVVSTVLNGGSGTVAVTGSASDGSTATFSPIQIGGKDGTGKIQTILTSPTGATVVDSSGTAIPVSGTVTVNAGTGNFTVVQPTGTNLHVVPDSGTITTVGAVTAITNALPAGSNQIGHVILDSGSTTGISGTVTATQATGTNLHTVVDSGTITAVTAITNPLPAGTNTIGTAGLPIVTTTMTSSLGGTVFTVVAASAQTLESLSCFNGDAAADAYVQIFDTMQVTPGTTTPKNIVGVPFGGGNNWSPGLRYAYANAIRAVATTTPTGGTPATTALVCNFGYKSQ